MKIIIAGSRSITNYDIVEDTMKGLAFDEMPITVVSGGADGVDTIGEQWANKYNNKLVKFDPTNASETMTSYDVNEYGKRAFLLRNTEMVEYADMLVAIWDGKSTGTRDTIDKALDNGLSVVVNNLNK